MVQLLLQLDKRETWNAACSLKGKAATTGTGGATGGVGGLGGGFSQAVAACTRRARSAKNTLRSLRDPTNLDPGPVLRWMERRVWTRTQGGTGRGRGRGRGRCLRACVLACDGGAQSLVFAHPLDDSTAGRPAAAGWVNAVTVLLVWMKYILQPPAPFAHSPSLLVPSRLVSSCAEEEEVWSLLDPSFRLPRSVLGAAGWGDLGCASGVSLCPVRALRYRDPHAEQSKGQGGRSRRFLSKRSEAALLQ